MNLKSMLIKHEGLRLSPYRDSVGKLTIGIGHNLDDKPISERAAMLIFEDDVLDAISDLHRIFPWIVNLDSVRQDVLVDMCFNLGVAGLRRFVHTLTAMQEGDYARAADEMLNSTWAKQVGLRASELSNIMRTGRYPEGG